MTSLEDNRIILETESTDKYYIEYQDFLSNHISHGLIALSRLGATTQRLDQFTKWYQPRLESPDKFAKENEGGVGDTDIDSLRGRRQAFYILMRHYESLLQTKYTSTKELIRDEFPKLYQGMAGSLLHGLIHLGYAQASGSQKLILEGLSYLHHSYLPLEVSHPEMLTQPLGVPGDLDLLQVLDLLKQDDTLDQTIDSKGKDPEDPHMKYLGRTARFQRYLGSLLTYKADELVQYANRIRLPEEFNPSKPIGEQRDIIMKWITDSTIKLFIMAETRNDFVILHAVTSAWSLKNIVSLVEKTSDVTGMVRVYLCILLAVYACREYPTLKTAYLPQGPAEDMPSWEKIIALAVSKEVDEHIYKLVQVCHDMTIGYPNDRQMAAVYKEAANVTLEFPLVLVPRKK